MRMLTTEWMTIVSELGSCVSFSIHHTSSLFSLHAVGRSETAGRALRDPFGLPTACPSISREMEGARFPGPRYEGTGRAGLSLTLCPPCGRSRRKERPTPSCPVTRGTRPSEGSGVMSVTGPTWGARHDGKTRWRYRSSFVRHLTVTCLAPKGTEWMRR